MAKIAEVSFRIQSKYANVTKHFASDYFKSSSKLEYECRFKDIQHFPIATNQQLYNLQRYGKFPLYSFILYYAFMRILHPLYLKF